MTHSNSKSGSQNFQLVDSSEEVRRFFLQAAKIEAPTQIWTQNQDIFFTTSLILFNQIEYFFVIRKPEEMNKKIFENELARKNTRQCFFNISLPSTYLFFTAEFIEFDGLSFKFKAPNHLYQVQRRKDFRFQIPKGHVLRIHFLDPRPPHAEVKKRVIDISPGGLSFLTESESTLPYKVGQTIENIKMILLSQFLNFNTEIKSISFTHSSQGSGTRVGLSFTKISTEHSRLISQYVFEESRAYFARLLQKR